MGGGFTKSAYWIVYISEKEKQATLKIDENNYDATEQDLETKHPYGAMATPNIIKKILDDNRALVLEVDTFKNNEVAKKVSTLYEKYFDEIQKITETKLANKDIASIYTYLITKPDFKDIGKRLLLDQCFFEETKQRVHTMERAQGILAKIEEKAASKSAWYPAGRTWMNQDDWSVNEISKSFAERHMAYVM